MEASSIISYNRGAGYFVEVKLHLFAVDYQGHGGMADVDGRLDGC